MFKLISALKPPFEDRLSLKTSDCFFRDAIVIQGTKEGLTPSQVQYRIFAHMPAWVNTLMNIRNRIVGVFGFEVGTNTMEPAFDELSVGEQAGFMTVDEKHDDEIISRAEDKHMEFYLSVRLQEKNVIVSTLVNKKTLIGRIYVNAILPFHYIIARTVVNSAVKAGRI